MSDQYIPDLTERYPEPEPTNEEPEVGEVWQHMKTKVTVRIVKLYDHYAIVCNCDLDDEFKIDLDDLKNKWVLIG